MKHIRNFLLLVIFGSFAVAESSENLVRFSSQPNDWFQSFEFRSRPAPKPDDAETVIVLLTKDLKSLDGKLLNPIWKPLISKNRVGIVALGYTPQVKPPKDTKPGAKSLCELYPQSARELLHRELKRQIRELFPRAKQYGYVTWDSAGQMAAGFLTDEPKETQLLVIEDQLWGIPERIRSLPACLVINRNKEMTGRMLEVQQRNRTNKRDITFVRGPAGDRTAIDQFIVDYLTAILSGEPMAPVIVDLGSEVELGKQVPRDKVANTTWLPEGLLASWRVLHSMTEKDRLSEIVHESVETGVASQPTLDLFLRLPSTVKPGLPPKGVLCIATWKRGEKSLYNILQHDTLSKELLVWADAQQMAVITWNTAILWKTGINQEDLERNTARHLDDRFDDISAAWDKGLRNLIIKYRLPNDGYLFFGISKGAHWGHRLALRRPERFSAVHFHVANSYDVPDIKAKNVLWLITSGELDGGYQASLEFYRKCRTLDYPIILKAGPNLGHMDREDIQKLGLAFFKYAVGLKNEGGQIKDSKPAPPLASSALANLMRRDLAKATLFGDFINQGVYKTDQASWVPSNQRIPLVSSEIAKAWGKQENQ